MMQQIPVEVDHVIGVKVSGKIERQDMDAMFALPNFKKFPKRRLSSRLHGWKSGHRLWAIFFPV